MTKYLQIDIDLLNIESSFFNDICYGSFLLNGKNLNLQERIKKLFLNYSVCDINCIYDKTNIQKKTISCNCTSLLNIESKIEEPKFKQKTLSYSQYSSLNIIKCYHIFFLSTLKTFGFWILLLLLIIRLYYYICFFKNGINQINNYVETEIKKYQYNIEEKERASNDDGHNKKKHEIITSEDIKIDNVEQNDITENEPKKNEIYTYTYIKNSNSRDDMIGEEEIKNKKTNKNIINNLDNEPKN